MKRNVRFNTIHYGQSGVMFEAEQERKNYGYQVEVEHLLYVGLMRKNADNKILVLSVDFLAYVLKTV